MTEKTPPGEVPSAKVFDFEKEKKRMRREQEGSPVFDWPETPAQCESVTSSFYDPMENLLDVLTRRFDVEEGWETNIHVNEITDLVVKFMLLFEMDRNSEDPSALLLRDGKLAPYCAMPADKRLAEISAVPTDVRALSVVGLLRLLNLILSLLIDAPKLPEHEREYMQAQLPESIDAWAQLIERDTTRVTDTTVVSFPER